VYIYIKKVRKAREEIGQLLTNITSQYNVEPKGYGNLRHNSPPTAEIRRLENICNKNSIAKDVVLEHAPQDPKAFGAFRNEAVSQSQRQYLANDGSSGGSTSNHAQIGTSNGVQRHPDLPTTTMYQTVQNENAVDRKVKLEHNSNPLKAPLPSKAQASEIYESDSDSATLDDAASEGKRIQE
jgi:hypothetical protein